MCSYMRLCENGACFTSMVVTSRMKPVIGKGEQAVLGYQLPSPNYLTSAFLALRVSPIIYIATDCRVSGLAGLVCRHPPAFPLSKVRCMQAWLDDNLLPQ